MKRPPGGWTPDHVDQLQAYRNRRLLAEAPPLTPVQAEWQTAVSSFVAHLASYGCAAHTVKLRKVMLSHLQVAYGNVGPWEITYTMLVDFLGNQTWAPKTRRAYRNTFRGFFTCVKTPNSFQPTRPGNYGRSKSPPLSPSPPRRRCSTRPWQLLTTEPG